MSFCNRYFNLKVYEYIFMYLINYWFLILIITDAVMQDFTPPSPTDEEEKSNKREYLLLEPLSV